jgi:hypothetical protein
MYSCPFTMLLESRATFRACTCVRIVDPFFDTRVYNMQVDATVAFGTLLFFNQGNSKASEILAGYVFSS